MDIGTDCRVYTTDQFHLKTGLTGDHGGRKGDKESCVRAPASSIVHYSKPSSMYNQNRRRPLSAPVVPLGIKGNLTARFTTLSTVVKGEGKPEGFYAYMARTLGNIGTKKKSKETVQPPILVESDISKIYQIGQAENQVDISKIFLRTRMISILFQEALKSGIFAKTAYTKPVTSLKAREAVISSFASSALFNLQTPNTITSAEAAMVAFTLEKFTTEDYRGEFTSLQALLNKVGRVFHLRIFGHLHDFFPHIFQKEPNFGLDITEEHMTPYLGFNGDDELSQHLTPLVTSDTICAETDAEVRNELTLKSTNNIRTAFLQLKVRAALSWLFTGIDYPGEFDYDPFTALSCLGFDHITAEDRQPGDLVVYLKKNEPGEDGGEDDVEIDSPFSALHWGVCVTKDVVSSMSDPFPPVRHPLHGISEKLRGDCIAFFRYTPGKYEIEITEAVEKACGALSESVGGATVPTMANLRSKLLGIYTEIDRWCEIKSDINLTGKEEYVVHGKDYYIDLKKRIAGKIPGQGLTAPSLKVKLKHLLEELESGRMFNAYFSV